MLPNYEWSDFRRNRDDAPSVKDNSPTSGQTITHQDSPHADVIAESIDRANLERSQRRAKGLLTALRLEKESSPKAETRMNASLSPRIKDAPLSPTQRIKNAPLSPMIKLGASSSSPRIKLGASSSSPRIKLGAS